MREHARVLTRTEARQILGEPTQRYYSPHRDYLVFRLMLETGIRPSEAVGITMDRVDFSTGRIVVVGKNDKQRRVWMKVALRDAVKSFLARRPQSKFLFPTRKGTKVETNHLRRSVKRYAEEAGISDLENVSPYSMRHTFATRLYEETSDLELVRDALGHERVQTTMQYVHTPEPTRQELKIAMTR